MKYGIFFWNRDLKHAELQNIGQKFGYMGLEAAARWLNSGHCGGGGLLMVMIGMEMMMMAW